MPQKLLTLPLRAGLGAARLYIDLAARAVRLAAAVVLPGSPEPQAPQPPPERPARPPARRRPPAPPSSRPNGRPPAPTTPLTPSPASTTALTPSPASTTALTPPPAPTTPLTPAAAAAKTIDDEPEVVAEFAEPGAEDGPGPEIDVAEPWEGYAGMNADAVLARVAQAGAEELALVELYERVHKNRQTVLASAQRRLRALAPPGG